jgi:hypothetical protein
MLYLAVDLSAIEKPDFDEVYIMTIEISKMLSGLIRSLDKKQTSP